MTDKSTREQDPEIVAISAVYGAVSGLEPQAQARVLNYVAAKLGIGNSAPDIPRDVGGEAGAPASGADLDDSEPQGETAAEFEGISPAARKWMTRNGFQPDQLSEIFSLGADEIDLVATTVPGKSKREKMRSVFLLKGIAAYIGTGAARFSHKQVKEACLHYGAFDSPNFAKNLKLISGEVSGTNAAGYALTTRGLSEGTKMVKSIISGE